MFTTSVDDVFYLPKLIGLWVLFVVLAWLGVWAAIHGRVRHRLRLIGVVDRPVAAFVLLNLVAFAFSVDRHQSLFGERLQHQGLLTTLLYVAFFYASRVLICDTRRALLLFSAVAVGATGVAGYAIVQKLGLDPIWKGYLPSGRVFSTIGQPNALAAYLVLAIPVTAALALQGSRLRRTLALTGMASMVVALLLTYSRGGYLGLAATVPVFAYGLLRRARLTRPALHLGAGVGIAAVVVGLALVPPARSVITGAWQRAWSVSAVSSDESIGNHLDQWKVAVRIIEAHPLIGTGPETFPEDFPTYSRMVLPAPTVRYFDQFRVESPHNQILAIASGAGIPTAIAYLILLGGIAIVLWRGLRSGSDAAVPLAVIAVMSAAAGHLVTDSFMSAEVTGSWLFWILIGATVGLSSTFTAPSDQPQSDSLDQSEANIGSRVGSGSAALDPHSCSTSVVSRPLR